MGRTNKTYRHTLELAVEVNAPNAEEALRRVEDVRDALQSRFGGGEIYPPRLGGSTSRIPGSPRFKQFNLIGGRPREVDPFDAQDESRRGLVDDLPSERFIANAVHLASLVRQSIEAGWVPSDGSIADALAVFEKQTDFPDLHQGT